MVWVHRKKMTHPKTPFLPYLHANKKKKKQGRLQVQCYTPVKYKK